MPNGFLNKTCTKRSKAKKKENHHRVLQIRNSVGTKFQFKLIILNFWTKLTQKGYFRSKKELKKSPSDSTYSN